MTARQKMSARSILNVNIRRGNITRNPCEECGSVENLEGHHEDYSKPLEVRWLCRAHHKEHHVKQNENRIRNCSRCAAPAMKGQVFCRQHHAAYMRDWRKDNPLNDEQKRKDIARSKVNVYVKRGKLTKTPCPCCGSVEVKARILDYADPLHTVEWLCSGAHAYAVRTGALPVMRRAA